jgi:hypothetical protein
LGFWGFGGLHIITSLSLLRLSRGTRAQVNMACTRLTIFLTITCYVINAIDFVDFVDFVDFIDFVDFGDSVDFIIFFFIFHIHLISID